MRNIPCLIITLLIASHSYSIEYYVDASRPNDAGAGTNWATAKKTIQSAVDLTLDGDTVWVTNGVYDTGGKITPGYSLTNRVCITNSITVQSVNGPEVTVIEGEEGVRGVFVNKASELRGFTVTACETVGGDGGTYDLCGAGIFLVTNGTISDCIISNNYAYNHGGGIFSLDGGTVTNSLLTNNRSRTEWGGGACLMGSGEIINCLLFNNIAARGGGLYLRSGGMADRCILKDNYASFAGGGVYTWNSGTVNNCLIFNNSTGRYCGGAWISSGSSMNNCTVAQNGNVNAAQVVLAYGVTLNNSIVWKNGANIGYQGAAASIVKNTCSPDGVTHGQNGCITNAPLFTDTENEVFKLQDDSPCIDSGDNILVSTSHDVDGNLRINNETVDMGAYEFVHFLISTISNDVFQWPAEPDRVYSVYWTANLSDEFQPLQTNIPWTCNSFTNLTGEPNAFFKVIAE